MVAKVISILVAKLQWLSASCLAGEAVPGKLIE